MPCNCGGTPPCGNGCTPFTLGKPVTPTPEARERLNRLMDGEVLPALFALERYVAKKGPNPPEIFDDRLWMEYVDPALGELRRDVLAAVRAALVAEMVAGVQGLCTFEDDPNHDGGEHRCHYCVEFDTLTRVLTYLHGLAPETDPNG